MAMSFRMIPFTIIQLLIVIVVASDFENARILGTPTITCSKRTINFSFDSNIPFQGRISVINKLFIPECNQDYSSNIQKNATFHVDISKCVDPNFLRNGSRMLTANIEIGFHPLVITNSDRVFQLECADNTPSQIVNIASETANCTHLVRMASKWDSMTDFHVGDAIVHEWSCQLPQKGNTEFGLLYTGIIELGKTQTFLTNCNALSQNGQIIHLIDENGCVIDSELMGEVVYNNYMPKLYARAKIFKLLTDEKYRIECNLEFCHKDSACRDRAFPPKCAFTREEIINRFNQKDNEIEQTSNTMMPGNPNMGYDKSVKISTAWLTVKYNQYTTIDGLHERYHLKTTLDPTLTDEKSSSRLDHFLMEISYREPNEQSAESKDKKRIDINRIEAAKILHPSAFQPILNPPIDDEEFIESITLGSNKVDPESQQLIDDRIPVVEHTLAANIKSKAIQPSTTTTSAPSTTTKSPIVITTTDAPTTLQKTTEATTIKLRTTTKKTPTTTRINFNIEKPEKREKINGAETSQQTLNLDQQNISRSLVQFKTSETTTTTTTRSPAARLQFYTDSKTKKLTPTTPYSEPQTSTTDEPKSTTELPFKVEETTFKEEVKNDQFVRKPFDKFVNNNADWRLDERAINDSDVLPEKQISAACSNATIISTPHQCKWTGVEHLLLIWSFASLLVWMVLIAVCFYRHSSRKPRWMAFREHELRRAAQSRVLSQDHPWLHADAFEERNQSKNEVEINKF